MRALMTAPHFVRFGFGSLLVCTLALVGCNRSNSALAPSTSSGGALSPDTAVATVRGQKITAAELDETVKAQLFQARKQGLEQMITERLIQEEAKKRNLTEEQFLKAEVDDKVPPPTEAQIKEMYDRSASQLPPGATLEQYRERIAEFMVRPQRQERAKQLFEQLRKDANVVVTLSEPRKQVEAKGPSRGPKDAKITIVEFSDFQCPFCSRAHDTVEQVMQAYPGKLRLVFRHFPLDFHKQAPKAAEAAMCADEQGKFWEYHDVLFKNQQKLEPADLKAHASVVGLDAGKFGSCLDSSKFAQAVKADTEAGKKVGVSGTPAFFINGVMLSGAQPYEEFKRVIDQELGTAAVN